MWIILLIFNFLFFIFIFLYAKWKFSSFGLLSKIKSLEHRIEALEKRAEPNTVQINNEENSLQRKVLEMAAMGITSDIIADKLNISLSEVDFIVSYKK